MIGSVRGRKPLVVDTMKAGNELSSGLVSLRTSKCGREVGVIEPMVKMSIEDEQEACDGVEMGINWYKLVVWKFLKFCRSCVVKRQRKVSTKSAKFLSFLSCSSWPECLPATART